MMYDINHPDCSAAGLLWRQGMGRTVELFDIGVPNSSRRQGIGRGLIEQLKLAVPDDTALIYAFVRYDNTAAQQFYESLGFRIVARLHDFYRDCPRNEHALMYGLDL